MDAPAHAQILLAALAQFERKAQGTAQSGDTLSAPSWREKRTGSLANGEAPGDAESPEHSYASPLWFPMLRGPAQLTQLRLNRRMRANRLSGGVGGVAGNSRHPDPIEPKTSRPCPRPYV